ncbi:MAG: PTS sugar transporter subunit IIA [Spirochaetaceae bacterium]|jgi:PTS system nitrogen regulatory IIA component|nr:PTS sugar transporter subunit IIA [Spirochaetaceae bacterium]
MNERAAPLSRLIERGGAARLVRAATVREAVRSFVSAIDVPEGMDRAGLITAVLEREDLMPTGAGHGIALPHPRSPLAAAQRDQFVAVGFLEPPVDWYALDREPVHTLFLIVSSSAREHLRTLSHLYFFCQKDSFQRLLRRRPPAQEIILAVQDYEQPPAVSPSPTASAWPPVISE